MNDQQSKPDHLLWAAGGLLAGAWWVKNQHDEQKKSRAERDDPDGVKDVCTEIEPILDDWEPVDCKTEEDYTNDLFEYLDDAKTDFRIEMCPSTREGKPDILIGDLLALEIKVDLSTNEMNRLIGQTARYSREWVTWIVLVDTPDSRIGALEKLLADKGLDHILVFTFS